LNCYQNCNSCSCQDYPGIHETPRFPPLSDCRLVQILSYLFVLYKPVHVKLHTKWGWLFGMEMDHISLKSRMVSWYKHEIVRAGVSNCMRQCLNFLVINVHIPAYLGSRGKPFFWNFEVFLWCLPIVDQYKFVHTNLYYTSSQT
jgi:hypothetical protein